MIILKLEEKMLKLKNEENKENDVVIEVKSGKVIIDEYTNPEHLKLGHEGYTKLREIRVVKKGQKFLEYFNLKHPDLKAYHKISQRHITNTEFTYTIKSRNQGLLSKIFPKTLVAIHNDNGMTPYHTLEIHSRNFHKDDNLEKLAKDNDLCYRIQ